MFFFPFLYVVVAIHYILNLLEYILRSFYLTIFVFLFIPDITVDVKILHSPVMVYNHKNL